MSKKIIDREIRNDDNCCDKCQYFDNSIDRNKCKIPHKDIRCFKCQYHQNNCKHFLGKMLISIDDFISNNNDNKEIPKIIWCSSFFYRLLNDNCKLFVLYMEFLGDYSDYEYFKYGYNDLIRDYYLYYKGWKFKLNPYQNEYYKLPKIKQINNFL